jgi:hypothetical protein
VARCTSTCAAAVDERQRPTIHNDRRGKKSDAGERTAEGDEHDPAPACAVRDARRANLLAHGSDGLHRRLAVQSGNFDARGCEGVKIGAVVCGDLLEW